MCGIAGILTQDSKRYERALKNMVEALRHRGPDGQGIDHFPNCSLGHTRLSIVDLETGGQPMRSSDGNLGITFNGEIYGYQKLRRQLTTYPFKTTSDTETILAMYERSQERLLETLPGMFAFGLWNDRKQELICARDRFGEKPLYYAFGPGGEFLFASEIKALLASGLITPILDKSALVHYLQRLYVHPHHTIYRNVYALPPAHMLRYADGKLSILRYWHLPNPRDSVSPEEAIAEFRRLLLNAVGDCLVADVPVGAFLSGGLDSSTIVAAASSYQPHLQTFSFGFGDSINELPYAREVARLYRTNHVELVDKDFDIGDLLEQMASVYDEPFADSSNIPTFLISKQARNYVKVVLTGDGGDELLAGYDWWYRPLVEMQNPRASHRALAAMFQTAAWLRKKLCGTLPESWQRVQEGMAAYDGHCTIAEAHYKQNVYFSGHDLVQLGLDMSLYEIPVNWKQYASGSVDDALRMDVEDYMPGDILVKIDRASMAHGLELRAPLLDVAFASFCISLPDRLKISSEGDKLILRQAFRHEWPRSIRARGKQGFGAPVREWLRLPSVVRLKRAYLDNPNHKLFEFLSFEGSRPFVARGDYHTWILLVLALWMEHWQN